MNVGDGNYVVNVFHTPSSCPSLNSIHLCSAWCCVLVNQCSHELQSIKLSLIKSATSSELRMKTESCALHCLDISLEIYLLVASAQLNSVLDATNTKIDELIKSLN